MFDISKLRLSYHQTLSEINSRARNLLPLHLHLTLWYLNRHINTHACANAEQHNEMTSVWVHTCVVCVAEKRERVLM